MDAIDPGLWLAFYRSDLQALYAKGVFPLLWLVHRAVTGPPRGGVDPACAGFVRAWCLLFAVETLLDPWITGPVARSLDSPGAATGLAVLFVLLGDLRVLWLVAHVAGPERPGRALALALAGSAAIPLAAILATRALAAAGGPLPEQALWIAHELLFLGLVGVLGRAVVPRRVAPGRAHVVPFLRSVLGFAAGYYALWALCDLLLLAGAPEAWALRAVPNQLYYGLTVPFVAWRFFAPRYASTRAALQTSR
ncbi:MAG: hypothetical protein R3263_08355 [Myxococcota bacterium]|nr:hypothetical protein [Myxococcota bacterium]